MSFTLVIDPANKLIDRPRGIALWSVLHPSDRATPAIRFPYLPLMCFSRFTTIDTSRHSDIVN